MKRKLRWNEAAKQFQADLGTKRFYLGSDADEAQRRKEALVEFSKRIEKWTDENIELARAISKGEPIQLRHTGDDDSYLKHEKTMARKLPKGAIIPAITERDLMQADNALLLERIAQLETIVREKLGEGAVEGANVSIHDALSAYNAYRLQTEIHPDTQQPKEHVRVETNFIKLIQRLIPADTQLSAMNYLEINKWCKRVVARPLSKKTGKPIKRPTVKNCLKLIRAFIKWAARNYGWKKPDDWEEATKVLARRTDAERRELIARIEGHYTLAEIGTLWKYALPVERMLILLGLNFGGAQKEVSDLIWDDVSKPETVAIRSKTDTIGKWSVWPETIELAKTQFNKIPRGRTPIANKWQQLLDRVTKDNPVFRTLSFKWLRKTGASYIRKAASQETASLYLSHGESSDSDDSQLAVYAAADWDKLNNALNEFRNLLLPHLTAETIDKKSYLPMTTIDAIKAGWKEGKTALQITKELKVGRATVYRWKPSAV